MNYIRSANYPRLCGFFSLLFFLFTPSFSINLDGAILFSFKNSILKDPSSVLNNWDYFDATPCLWTGVTCARVESYFGVPDVFRVVSLALPNCNLLGTIPEELGFIQYLRVLDLSNNSLNGTLPSSLFNNQELQVLSLANNEIFGVIPESFSGLNSLKFLNLSDNFLSGNVPKSLTSLKNLTVVSLRGNSFSGSVLSGIQYLEFLDLSSNLLNGSLPKDFDGENLSFLNLSSNRISGLLNEEFAGKIPPNATIDLSFNNLFGEIPDSVPLSDQKTELFAGNTGLCGKQIKKICAVPSASPAIAAVPQIIDSNPLQNSSNNGLKPGAMAGIVVGSVAAFILLAVLLLCIYQNKKKATSNEYELGKDSDATVLKESRNLPSWPCSNIEHQPKIRQERINIDKMSLVMVDGETKLELETLLKASAYVLGSSGVSIVYKAVLQNGTAFAVRRIGKHGFKRFEEFENRVKAIAKLRHPNLVRIRGFHWGDEEKLIIYDYVSNGSLASTCYRKDGSSHYKLTFEARRNIATGVAKGLICIHERKHVHGNIKPSNILLTPDTDPIISDFGLHWLIHEHKYVHNVDPVEFVVSACPYRAPESLENLKSNSKWDVYSFGILLLELLTGKVFSGQELDQLMVNQVAEDPERVLSVADVALRRDLAGHEESMLQWFRLGLSCASLIPQKRPSMKDALQVLEKMAC
ncbi:receptor protein kinase-like protein At4g34220 [Primulina huaijiensis]|uniref:receptor protein kinase-like protein At4g34220 n=1 Tax=Primulina huaijiensis TaxID=1492673 RepID=UPI003CC779C6